MSLKSILIAALFAATTLAAPTSVDSSVVEFTTPINRPFNMSTSTTANANTFEDLAAANTPFCNSPDGTPGTVSGAQSCIKYLEGLGTKKCKFSGKPDTGISMCEEDDTTIALGIFKSGSVTMSCSTAVNLAKKVLNTCESNGKIHGAVFVPKNEYSSTGFKPAADAVEIFIQHY